MPEVIITGTKTCQWPLRTPSVAALEAHTNVDETMQNHHAASFVVANAIGSIFEVYLGPTTIIGELGFIKTSFYYTGEQFDFIPGARFELFMNGQSLVPPVEVRMLAAASTAGQITWLHHDILVKPLLGIDWNAASSAQLLTGRCTTIDAGAVADPPPPFIQETD